MPRATVLPKETDNCLNMTNKVLRVQACKACKILACTDSERASKSESLIKGNSMEGGFHQGYPRHWF